MSIADKLLHLVETKALLRDAINWAGGDITSETPFRSYSGELVYALWAARVGLRPLFDNGETGTLASDLPYFVDVDGNTPAALGDPVGLIKDSSGNGNDFTQPTVTARPILGRVPRDGRRNLYSHSQPDTDNPQWISSAPGEGNTVTRIGREPGPNGIEGVRYHFERLVDRNALVGVGYDEYPAGDYTHSLWVKSGDGETYTVASYSTSSGTLTFEVGPEWQRIVIPSFRDEDGMTRPCWFGLTNNVAAYNTFADIIIADGQFEIGEEATDFQQVITPYDITESDVPDVYYLNFDGTDDLISTELPAIENGTLVIAGTNGIWIDDDFSFDGGTFSIGPGTYSGGLVGLLDAIGNPLVGGALVINRQLTTAERVQVVAYMKSIGSPGLIELGPELLVNSDFSDGFDGWEIIGPGSERWSVSDGVATIAVGTTHGAYLRQYDVTEEGLPYLITVDLVSSNGVSSIRAGGGSDNLHSFQLADHPVGELSAVYVAGGFQPNLFSVSALAETQASMSSISLREVILP